MATITLAVATASTVDQSTPYTSGSFTPAVGDYLIGLVMAAAETADGVFADSQGLTWVPLASNPVGAGWRMLTYITTTPAAAVPTTISYDPTVVATGCILSALRLGGLSTAPIVRQVKSATAASGTAAVTMDAAILQRSICLGFATDASNVAALTPPAGFIELSDIGIGTPTVGFETCYALSGQVGPTITWGAGTTGLWGATVIELLTEATSSALANGGDGTDRTTPTALVSPAFTPNTDDLLICVVVDAEIVQGTLTDTQGLGWTLVASRQWNGASPINQTLLYIANTLATNVSMTVSYAVGLLSLGCNIIVSRVVGISGVGAAAVRQTAQNNAGTGNANATMASAILAENYVFGVGNDSSNPASLTPPASWYQMLNTGVSGPVMGSTTAYRGLGETGTVLTWPAGTTGQWCAIFAELIAAPIPSVGSLFWNSGQSSVLVNNAQSGYARGILAPLVNSGQIS